MAQYQVPQFIETEDKIVGPLTLRQFIYLAIAGLIIFFLFFILQLWVWVIISSALVAIAGSLAFLKYNGRPMHRVVVYALKYFWRPRFYIWKKPEIQPATPEIKIPKIELVKPGVAEEKIERAKKPLLKNLWLKIQTGTQTIAQSPIAIFHKATSAAAAPQSRRIDYR